MASFNQWIGIGNVCADPQSRQTGSGSTVAAFSIACNRRYTTSAGEKREEVFYMDCEAWGKAAETIAQYVSKGKPLMVSGRLATDEWEDKDGNKRRKTKCVVQEFQFLGSRDAGPSGENPSDADESEQQTRELKKHFGKPAKTGSSGGPGNPIGNQKQFEEDGIPFSPCKC